MTQRKPTIRPIQYGAGVGRRVGGKMANWLKVLIPARKLGPADKAALLAAEEKRERRHKRNRINAEREKNGRRTGYNAGL